MPAARQRSRSPFIACAVIAMMRTWRAVRAFALANRGRRFEAVHLRHLQVHQHEVEGVAFQSVHRFAPVGHDDT